MEPLWVSHPLKKPAKPCFEGLGGRRNSRALTTCASPLRLRSGQSRGPRADHRQDDASEGSPTLISSLGREERGGCRVMQIEIRAVGLRLPGPPSSPRGEAPTRAGGAGPGDCWRFAAVGARGREDCGSRPSPPEPSPTPQAAASRRPEGELPGDGESGEQGSQPRAGRPVTVELTGAREAGGLPLPTFAQDSGGKRRGSAHHQGV